MNLSNILLPALTIKWACTQADSMNAMGDSGDDDEDDSLEVDVSKKWKRKKLIRDGIIMEKQWNG